MDYYKILNVSKNATSDEIKKQYKKMALKYHPDRSGGDTEMFKKVSEAYEILSNPEKKSEYDNPSPFSQQMPRTHFYHSRRDFVDSNIIFKEFFNNSDFFQKPLERINTRTFNIRTGSMGVTDRRNVYQKRVSTQIRGNTKIETTTEVRNGVKREIVKEINMETGQTSTNIKEINS